MYRKCFAAVVAAMLVAGGLFAEEIKGMFKKYEDGKVTIEVNGKDKTYKVSTEAKVKVKGKEDVLLTKALKDWPWFIQATLTIEKDEVVMAKKDKKK